MTKIIKKQTLAKLLMFVIKIIFKKNVDYYFIDIISFKTLRTPSFIAFSIYDSSI